MPAHTDRPQLGVKSTRNFVGTNAVKNAMTLPKQPCPRYVDRPTGSAFDLEVMNDTVTHSEGGAITMVIIVTQYIEGYHRSITMLIIVTQYIEGYHRSTTMLIIVTQYIEGYHRYITMLIIVTQYIEGYHRSTTMLIIVTQYIEGYHRYITMLIIVTQYIEGGYHTSFFLLVQQPKAIYLANPVLSDKVFFPVDYISFGCI